MIWNRNSLGFFLSSAELIQHKFKKMFVVSVGCLFVCFTCMEDNSSALVFQSVAESKRKLAV